MPAHQIPAPADPAITPSARTSSPPPRDAQPTTSAGTKSPPALAALPPPPVEVDGPAVPLLDTLGPVVVHADGTLSRIANWPAMTEVERRNTLRVLGRRNRERTARLRAGEGEGGAEGGGEEGEGGK